MANVLNEPRLSGSGFCDRNHSLTLAGRRRRSLRGLPSPLAAGLAALLTALLPALLAVGGCAGPKAASHVRTGDASTVTMPGGNGAAPAKSAIARPLLTLQVYQMTLPAGGVSRNEEFWKHVDEQRIDPATYDLLQKNGVRVGIAPNDDWEYFKEILQRNHAQAQTGVATAAGTGAIELTMRSQILEEDIFYLDDHGNPRGRTYEHCDNLLGVSFTAEPRHPGEVRVAIAPTIRSLRSHLEFLRSNEAEAGVVREVRPEYLYDLNLEAIVPPNSFLVIAPSRESKFVTSLGNTFFRLDGIGEQYEQVLVLVPRASTRIGPRGEPTAAAR